ncbi:helix-turn-helix domain-containing protein [Clostridiaceae bacterium 35-E11]
MIIEDMKKLGFSEYEVKAYLKLLETYPVNGYTLSKNSGIPRSRIYEVLESLKGKQMVFEQIEGDTTLYHPLEPKLLINKLKAHYKNILDNVDQYTQKAYVEEICYNKLMVVEGRKNIIAFLNLRIKDAKKRIALSIWEEEIKDISQSLDEAIHRGVTIKGIYFGKNNPYQQLVTHRRVERYLAEKKERYMTVTIDGEHALYGVISRGEESKVTWTKDPGFVDMGEDYICHDLMVNLYANKLEKVERKDYEDFLDKVRKEYFDFTEEEFNDFK